MEIEFNDKELEFIKKYCPDWKQANDIKANEKLDLIPKHFEELFWDNLRDYIRASEERVVRNKKIYVNLIEQFSDDEFLVLCSLAIKTRCIFTQLELISVSGLMHRIEEECKRRNLEVELGTKVIDFEIMKTLDEEELEEEFKNFKNKRYNQFKKILKEYARINLDEFENYRFMIPPEETVMLWNTTIPKKLDLDLLRLPFEDKANCYLDFILEDDKNKIKFPYGFLITENQEFDEKEEEDIRYTCKYDVYVPFVLKDNDGLIEMIKLNLDFKDYKNTSSIEDEWSEKTIHEFLRDPYGDAFWNISKKLKDFEECISFILGYILFLNDPRVSYRYIGKQNIKDYTQQKYSFKEPKTMEVVISNELKKYINLFKKHKTGIKMEYQYQFIVRGHFRALRSTRYKNPKRIWITPYFKGKGKFYKKDYILEAKPIKRSDTNAQD